MLIYEKDNKLNINFDPSKSIEGTPDIQIGENEIKLGDAEITSENVLPTPTNDDVGKVPTVQEDGTYSLENIPSELPVATPEDEGKVVSVDENGEYALAEAGGGSEPLVVTFSGTTNNNNAACDKTIQEIMGAGKNIRVWYKNSSNALSEMQVTGLSENQLFATLIKAGIMGGNGVLMDITTATINPLETIIKTANFSS